VIGDKEIVVPEDWRKNSDALIQRHLVLAKATEELTARSLDAENAAREEAMELKKSFSELMEMFLVQQKNFDEKDAEILRLKKGYDSEIFRRFLSRFIRVDQVIRDYQERGTIDLDGLRQIALVLEDAFAEAGVAAFAPAAGTAYRDAVGVNDSPRIVHTEDPELIGKIKEVIDLGYRLNNGEIITPVKVAIYGNTKKESI